MRLRAKDVVKEWLRHIHEGDTTEAAIQELEMSQHWVFMFAYWLEGQDRDPMDCRYHVVAASESECPFNVLREIQE